MHPYTRAFAAYRIHADKGTHRAGLESVTLEPPAARQVVVEIHYSSVNYKDAVAGLGRGRILRRSPLVGGIDLAGVVVDTADHRFRSGDTS